MERLLDLLQEFYGENRKFSNDDGLLTMTNGVENLSGAYAQTYIISLKGGFIGWLVENDKIDKDKLYSSEYKPYFWSRATNAFSGFWAENILLMLLAISDTPIEDLISYLR